MAQMMMRSTRISPNMPVLLFFRLDQALLNPFFTDPTSSLQPDAGIDHAIRTSTMKLITTKITAIRKTMHSTTAKSLVVMLWMTRRPTPGQAKTCSVMTEPPSREANACPGW